MIDKILKSKSMQNMMLGQFKKVIKEENIKAVVITVDEKENASVEYFKEEIKIIPITQWKEIQKQLQEIL